MIALFRGTGPVAAAIRWQTRGQYAHAAWVASNGTCIEAHGVTGVVKTRHPWVNNDGPADIYAIRCLTGAQMVFIHDFLLKRVGRKYDWLAITRFLSGINRDNENRWFCSELVAEACAYAGRPLLHADAWRISPVTLGWSTELSLVQAGADMNWWNEKFGGHWHDS